MALPLSWAVIVTLLSIAPGDELPDFSWEFFTVDTFMHVVFYFLGTLFFGIGFHKQLKFRWLRTYASRNAFLLCFIIGLALELIQGGMVPTRYFHYLDLVANLSGCLLGVAYYKVLFSGIV